MVVEASWEEDDADYSDDEDDGVDMFDDEDTPPEDDEEDGESEEDVYMGQGQYSNDVGKDYIPASDDVLAKEYIQPTGTQIISSCFPATLEYVNHLLGGSINEGVYQMQYFYQTSKFIFTSGGISPQEAENLICFNFEVVWYSNVKEAIDEGAVVFSSICNGTHSVAIMGYTNSQEYVYYDPMHINWRVADYSNFINSYNIPVIGIKNNK